MDREENWDSNQSRKESPSTQVETRRRMKNRWGKLSNEQIDTIKEDKGLLAEQLVKTYGFSKDFAKSESDTFFKAAVAKKPENSSNLGDSKSSVPRMSARMQTDHSDSDYSPYSEDLI